jgi:hypothetical protein
MSRTQRHQEIVCRLLDRFPLLFAGFHAGVAFSKHAGLDAADKHRRIQQWRPRRWGAVARGWKAYRSTGPGTTGGVQAVRIDTATGASTPLPPEPSYSPPQLNRSLAGGQE